MTDTFLALVALCGGGLVLIINFWVKNQLFAIIGSILWFLFGIHCVVQHASGDPAFGNLTWAFGILAFILALVTWFLPRMLKEKEEVEEEDETEAYHAQQRKAWREARNRVGKRDEE